MTRRSIGPEAAEAAGQLNLVLEFTAPEVLGSNHRQRRAGAGIARKQRKPVVDEAGRLPAPVCPPVRGQIPDLSQQSDVILKLPVVKARTGLSRSSIYALIDKKLFPAQVRLGPMSVGWSETEINAWVEGRKRQRAQTGSD